MKFLFVVFILFLAPLSVRATTCPDTMQSLINLAEIQAGASDLTVAALAVKNVLAEFSIDETEKIPMARLSRNLEFHAELSQISKLLTAKSMQQPAVAGIIGTIAEAQAAIKAADRFAVHAAKFAGQFPDIITFGRNMRVLLYYEFRNVKHVTAEEFSQLGSAHKIAYFELSHPATLKSLRLSHRKHEKTVKLIDDALKAQRAFGMKQSLWHDFSPRDKVKSPTSRFIASVLKSSATNCHSKPTPATSKKIKARCI